VVYNSNTVILIVIVIVIIMIVSILSLVLLLLISLKVSSLLLSSIIDSTNSCISDHIHTFDVTKVSLSLSY